MAPRCTPSVSGLGEHLAEDDREALGIARDIVARTGWQMPPRPPATEPRFDAEDLLSLMPAHHREPVDMREVMARITDGSDILEFKPLYGAATVCAQAHIGGHAVGIISNNGPYRRGGRQQGHALHPVDVPARPSPSSTCRTPPATWSARTASRPA